MAWPVVVVASGGLAVTEAHNSIGVPVDIATNGFGTAVTIVASGAPGIAVVGVEGVSARISAVGDRRISSAGNYRKYA